MGTGVSEMELIQDVVGVMEELNYVHQKLIDMEQLKTEALIQNNTSELVEYIHQQTKLARNVDTLEQKRQQFVEKWLAANNLVYQHLSLVDLIKMIPHHEAKQELSRLGEQLQTRMDELRNLNQSNQQLIEQSLSYINFTLRLAMNDPNDHLTYGRSKQPERTGSAQRGFFDSKA
ncbi:hypothetical protein BEP19_07500 [Ammoniphilus oxalaticus]|uniref:Flagellar biosynthesis protein FlgN n=2 Tax=Ammoniphilus oxalaticus TaxID=66863 RepID=A0A419SJN1_9BACL|nr:hypothetical protein BEP19_07500 [Ammoniphilus oxalaticus]